MRKVLAWQGSSCCCGVVVVVVVVSPGAVASVDASGEVVVAVVTTGIVKEISPGAETVTVDHPSWSLEGGQGGVFHKTVIYLHLQQV